jgi:hypothetical protein
VRTEKGVGYGDTIDVMDFPYLAKIVKLNTAALAAIASAPPPPEPKVEGAVSTDTALTWRLVPARNASYRVWRRRTDENQWQLSTPFNYGDCEREYLKNYKGDIFIPEAVVCHANLPHIRVDDWVFGVSSVSADGFESPVASAVPGGAFKPYVAPPTK